MMRIVLASDENMIGPLGVCLKSIAQAHNGRDHFVSVLCGEVSAQSKAALRAFAGSIQLPIELIDVDGEALRQVAATLPEQRFTYGTLLRLMIGTVFPADVRRILYIDIDTLVMRDLTALFDMDLGDAVAAVRRTPMGHLAHLGVPPESYFNSGVMLVNLDRWRTEGFEKKTFATITAHAQHLTYWDQCALNIALAGRTIPLDATYNHIFDASEPQTGDPLPHIIHYAGAYKPWPNAAAAPWGELYYRMSVDTPWPVAFSPPISAKRRLRLFVQRLFSRHAEVA